jgi:hypothetical protein
MRAYKAFISLGYEEAKVDEVIASLSEMDTEAATKGDLGDLKQAIKEDIRDAKESLTKEISNLEIRLLRELNSQTWKFLGGLAVIGIVLKMGELLIQHFVK